MHSSLLLFFFFPSPSLSSAYSREKVIIPGVYAYAERDIRYGAVPPRKCAGEDDWHPHSHSHTHTHSRSQAIIKYDIAVASSGLVLLVCSSLLLFFLSFCFLPAVRTFSAFRTRCFLLLPPAAGLRDEAQSQFLSTNFGSMLCYVMLCIYTLSISASAVM